MLAKRITVLCFKTPKAPSIPRPAPAPNPADAEKSSLAANERRRAAEQQGAAANIFTSPLGDTNYGKNAGPAAKLAKLGA